MPELRKDPVTREWVIIATERGRRPCDFQHQGTSPGRNQQPGCPFCPGNEHMTPPEVLAFRSPDSPPNGQGWWVRVVPNKYPALAVEGNLGKTGRGMYDTMNGVGAHEVIIETPDHASSLGATPLKQVEDVLWAYRARYLDLKQDPRLKYILFFRNHGEVAGASLSHPHSQLIATPMVPHDVADEIEGFELYEQYHDRCVYCDVLRQELSDGERVVAENPHFLAFEPYASKYPFETWILPKRHFGSFAGVTTDEQQGLAEMLKEVLLRVRGCLDDPPYNYSLHTAPCDARDENRWHWHLEIMPRLTVAAGFEMGTGIYINVTPPEQAAAHLREVKLEVEQLA
jgi:UDPglucose--hexose-1-phosphate uridylyltransferase